MACAGIKHGRNRNVIKIAVTADEKVRTILVKKQPLRDLLRLMQYGTLPQQKAVPDHAHTKRPSHSALQSKHFTYKLSFAYNYTLFPQI